VEYENNKYFVKKNIIKNYLYYTCSVLVYRPLESQHPLWELGGRKKISSAIIECNIRLAVQFIDFECQNNSSERRVRVEIKLIPTVVYQNGCI